MADTDRRPVRLTRRLDICASCRMSRLMESRAARGASTVAPVTAKAVLWALCNHCNDDGEAWPDIGTIARDSDASPRTVQRAIEIMRDEGLLSVRNRARGDGAGRKRTGGRNGATNAYFVDWAALDRLGTDGRHPVVGTDARLTHVPGGTGVNGAWNGRQPGEERASTGTCSKEEPIEPTEPTPLPPVGGHDGGESEPPPGLARPDRSWASEIVAAYPPTSSDLLLADEDAVAEAIAAERAMPGGATPEEILAAARDSARLAASSRVQPPWCRTWASRRGYWRHVCDSRRSAASAAALDARRSERAERDRREDEAAEAWRRRIDAVVDSMPQDAIEDLRRRAVDAAPNEFVRRLLAGGSVRDMVVRSAIVAVIERDGLAPAISSAPALHARSA